MKSCNLWDNISINGYFLGAARKMIISAKDINASAARRAVVKYMYIISSRNSILRMLLVGCY